MLAVVLAAGALSFLAITLLKRGGTLAEGPPAISDPQLAAEMAKVEGFEPPGVAGAERDQVLERIQAAVREAVQKSPIPEGDQAAVEQIATERLMLYAFPDQEEYAAQVSRYTGLAWAALEADGLVIPPEQWKVLARPLEHAAFAFEHLSADYVPPKGPLSWESVGGRKQNMRDMGLYSDTDPSRVAEVLVPVRFDKWRGLDGPVDMYLVLHFRKREADARWVPYSTSLFEPSARVDPMPTPWI